MQGSVERFSMTLSCGHSWDGLRLDKLRASIQGSSANSESGGALSGNCTSKNSPGQIVLQEVGVRSTKATSGWEETG